MVDYITETNDFWMNYYGWLYNWNKRLMNELILMVDYITETNDLWMNYYGWLYIIYISCVNLSRGQPLFIKCIYV